MALERRRKLGESTGFRLFEDQNEDLEELVILLGYSKSDIIREGIDIIIKKLKKEGEKK